MEHCILKFRLYQSHPSAFCSCAEYVAVVYVGTGRQQAHSSTMHCSRLVSVQHCGVRDMRSIARFRVYILHFLFRTLSICPLLLVSCPASLSHAIKRLGTRLLFFFDLPRNRYRYFRQAVLQSLLSCRTLAIQCKLNLVQGQGTRSEEYI